MMNKAQWITAGIAILIVIGIYAATEKHLFGPSKKLEVSPIEALPSETSISIDSIVLDEKKHLSPEQNTRLSLLEHSISRGDVKDQQLHIYHQLASFWADSARAFTPYAWYTAEGARLENSEKSLTFAARLFLDRLVDENDSRLKQWEALQAEDLFNRSLKLDPGNDSTKVALGSVYIYGGIAMPMKGISLIREVADRDSTNVYAQWTLGQASMYSGQLDKAADRFQRVLRLQPSNPEAMLLLAEVEEQMGNNTEAIRWYGKLLPLINNSAMKQEVEARIANLKK